jgi:glucose-1-phosphate thymidylyltransferase
MLGGIKEFLLISTPEDTPRFQQLLGDGSPWGISIEYAVQEKPDGIAKAFVIGEKFIGKDPVTLILGDNLFYGSMKLDDTVKAFTTGAKVFGYYVKDPERYGVVEFDADRKVVGIEEKPKVPKSNYAVPGLYIYDNDVVQITKNLKPSPRGELEITDLNIAYLKKGKLSVQLLGRGIAWLDTGTHASMLEASTFIYTLEARQGLKIACLEEIAYLRRFITLDKFKDTVNRMPKSPYKDYLLQRFKGEV